MVSEGIDGRVNEGQNQQNRSRTNVLHRRRNEVEEGPRKTRTTAYRRTLQGSASPEAS